MSDESIAEGTYNIDITLDDTRDTSSYAITLIVKPAFSDDASALDDNEE